MGYPKISRRNSGSWDIPTFLFSGYPKCDKGWTPDVRGMGYPNCDKGWITGKRDGGLLCVITVLQIATPPYGLIIDLSI